jgi:hypothetical protein
VLVGTRVVTEVTVAVRAIVGIEAKVGGSFFVGYKMDYLWPKSTVKKAP